MFWGNELQFAKYLVNFLWDWAQKLIFTRRNNIILNFLTLITILSNHILIIACGFFFSFDVLWTCIPFSVHTAYIIALISLCMVVIVTFDASCSVHGCVYIKTLILSLIDSCCGVQSPKLFASQTSSFIVHFVFTLLFDNAGRIV